MALLTVNNLCISLKNEQKNLVNQLSFSLDTGKTLAIVGESGSGKSLSCNAILGLMPSPALLVNSGTIKFNGRDLLSLTKQAHHMLRGTEIAMVFQDPMTCLTPHLSIGVQLTEALIYKRKVQPNDAKHRALKWLNDVGIKDPAWVNDALPSQLSGGMRQRAMIAMALIEEPKLLIADEPTTALDATVQAEILQQLKMLQQKHDLSMIFVSHDLAVVKELADDILVMQHGETQEYTSAKQLFSAAQSDYTRSLIAAIPQGQHAEAIAASDEIICSIKDFHAHYRTGRYETKQVLDDINLNIRKGEILGLVGESGSGKSTLGKCIVGLHHNFTGDLVIDGSASPHETKPRWFKRSSNTRKHVQMVFQDPLATLNPRWSIFETLAEPLLIHGESTRKHLKQDITALLAEVEMDADAMHRYPHQFSGGQRQRLAIARALAPKPKLLIADEPVSALDVTIQAQILELFLKLQKNKNLTILFISHDLSVVRYLCNRVAVLEAGKICEINETQLLWSAPRHPYTKTLLASTLSI